MSTMILILGILLNIAIITHGDLIPKVTTAYNYFEIIGIPEASRIKNAEEEYADSHRNRIVGGSAAETNAIPYQAGLIIQMEDDRAAVCGASLLSANTLVTAGHCWYDGQNQAALYTVVLGTLMLFSGGTRVNTSDVITHPDWNPSLIQNDIAMIKLSTPVVMSESISPINLPSGSELQQKFAGATVVASGYGKISDTSTITQGQFLSAVTLKVNSNFICWFAFPGIVRSSNICTSGLGRKGACGGDSGGPLSVVSNNRNVLVGVVSFGSALGCESGFPTVYTRTTSYIDFINTHLD